MTNCFERNVPFKNICFSVDCEDFVINRYFGRFTKMKISLESYNIRIKTYLLETIKLI